MKTASLHNMVGGWFMGNFTPTVYRTEGAEAAVKTYRAGDSEGAHFHKIATELTVIVSGAVRMNGKEYGAGDIILIEPGEITDFQSLTDATTVVVKIPGASHDKYVVGDRTC